MDKLRGDRPCQLLQEWLIYGFTHVYVGLHALVVFTLRDYDYLSLDGPTEEHLNKGGPQLDPDSG